MSPEVSAAIVIDPEALVIVTPSPAVRVAKEGSEPVEPISSCPSVGCAVAVIAAVPEPRRIPPSVRVVAPVPPLPTLRVPAEKVPEATEIAPLEAEKSCPVPP